MIGILSPLGEMVHNILKDKFSGRVVNNEFLYFCPFHDDKRTPNLYVNYEKGLFYCFACRAAGNLEQLYSHLAGLPPVPDNPFTFQYAYWRDVWNRKTEKVADKDIDFLAKIRGLSPQTLIESDVRKINGIGDEPAADLSQYFLFPSYNEKRNILLSFVGYSHTAKKKYIIPKGMKVTPFGMHLIAYKDKPTFLVEGLFDCLTLYETKVNSIALLGTNHASNISYIHPCDGKLILLPDFDNAGQNAAYLWAFEALLSGHSHAEIWLPKNQQQILKFGKDANDLKRKSTELLLALIEGKLTTNYNICEFLIEKTKKNNEPLYPILYALALCAPFPVYAHYANELCDFSAMEMVDRITRHYLSGSLPFERIFRSCKRELAIFFATLKSAQGKRLVLEYFLPHEVAPFLVGQETIVESMPGILNDVQVRIAIKRLAKVVRACQKSSLEELANIYINRNSDLEDTKGGMVHEN